MTKNRGSKFHPSRISGHQKFLRAKQANEQLKKPQPAKVKPLDTTKGDWSIKK